MLRFLGRKRPQNETVEGVSKGMAGMTDEAGIMAGIDLRL